MAKHPKDGDGLNLSRKVEAPAPFETTETKKWQPTESKTFTYTFGQGVPTPSPSLEEMAAKDVDHYYSYLPKGSAEYKRRQKEFLAKYLET